jgi:hypothetical protein
MQSSQSVVGGGNSSGHQAKRFIERIMPRKKKPWTYSVMKQKQIAKRRMRNKMARQSRRKNRLRNG